MPGLDRYILNQVYFFIEERLCVFVEDKEGTNKEVDMKREPGRAGME